MFLKNYIHTLNSIHFVLFLVFIFLYRLEDTNVDADLFTLLPKRRKQARADALQKARSSGKYPEFIGLVGPVQKLDPSVTPCLDFVKLLWLDSL